MTDRRFGRKPLGHRGITKERVIHFEIPGGGTTVMTIDLSVIIPVKDEAENIQDLAREISEVMDTHGWAWECLWINDGSSDDTQSILDDLVQQDSRHRYVTFEFNAGQSAALWAGFREARGAILATIDGDGQNDPRDIPRLVEMITSGQVDMANGYRMRRQDSLTRKVSSWVANAFRNAVTGRTVRDVGCSTRAFKRECFECLPHFAGMHRFLPTLIALQGFRLGEYPVNHRPRLRGRSKYNISNRLWVGLFDTMGVFWLRKRAFRHTPVRRSGEAR